MAGFTNKTVGGFRYHSCIFGQNIVPNTVERQVATAYGTGIFEGDPVNQVSDGSVDAAALGEAVFGISTGNCFYNDGGVLRNRNYIPASSAYTTDALRSRLDIIPAFPGVIFEIDADEGTTVTTIAGARLLVGENCDHANGTGDTNTGRSAAVLDISTHNTTTQGWRIWDVSRGADNNLTVTRGKWLVMANESDNLPGAFSATGI